MTTKTEETEESRKNRERQGGPEAEQLCPFCQLYAGLIRLADPQSEFCRHLQMARVEFYKALRSLIDQRLDTLEKAAQASSKKGFKKIKVEEG
jgi:hypothetical protein